MLILNGLAIEVFLGDFPDLQIMNKRNEKWSRESLLISIHMEDNSLVIVGRELQDPGPIKEKSTRKNWLARGSHGLLACRFSRPSLVAVS